MRKSEEYNTFDSAMDTILKADPKAVKAAMEADKNERAQGRKAKRKPKGNLGEGVYFVGRENDPVAKALSQMSEQARRRKVN